MKKLSVIVASVAVASALLAAGGCVRTSTHEMALAQLEDVKADLKMAREAFREGVAETEELQAQLSGARSHAKQAAEEIEQLKEDATKLSAEISNKLAALERRVKQAQTQLIAAQAKQRTEQEAKTEMAAQMAGQKADIVRLNKTASLLQKELKELRKAQ